MDDNKNFSLLAIVAIVAIIGLVVLVNASSKNSGKTSSEGATGEAYSGGMPIRERVTCVFDSAEKQSCYTTDNKFYCSGIRSCVVDVFDLRGRKLTFKSSLCGTYAYIVI